MSLSNLQKQSLKESLNGLMSRYKQRVPAVNTIINAMVEQNIVNTFEDIINDHIAFRTMGIAPLGIQSFEKIFLHFGYQRRDKMNFKQKKLNAFWYSPPDDIPNLPRVFISECRVHELSEHVQNIIQKYTSEVTSDPVNDLDLNSSEQVTEFFHKPLWGTPTWEEYQTVLNESEYAAWVLYNRYYLNHFTITIQALKKGYNDIESFNHFLESLGIQLNTAGGKIKVSEDKKLLQSSTVAEQMLAEFPHDDQSTGSHLIAGSYVEFAQRIDGRDGFEVGNADKIFESTFSDQINQAKG